MKTKHIWTLVTVLAVIGIGYFTLSPLWRNKTLNEALPSDNSAATTTSVGSTETLSAGTLVASAHGVAGTASIVQAGDQKYLRFENLDTINGPDLRIYLSASQSNDDYVDLGAIRATQGNVNYEIPAGTDTSKYHYALIWCRTFHVLFSYADLK